MSIALVFACDEQYAMPLATAIRSAVESNRGCKYLEIFILTSKFSPAMRKKVENSLPAGAASIRWVNADLDSFDRFSTRTYISKITYARLLLPQYLPESIAKVLYLDADILVLGNLEPLWEIDLEGAPFGAVLDANARDNAQRLGLATDPEDRKPGLETTPDEFRYFNAGVLLVDLIKWREEQISEKAMQFMISNPRTLVADQDALNVACGGRWKRLDTRWNYHDVLHVEYARMRPEKQPFIMHFAGSCKPWDATHPLPNLNGTFYDGFRNRTQFARTSADKARDTVVRNWVAFKRFFKRFKLISTIHGYFARPKTA